MSTFAVSGIPSPMIILFGVPDLLGALRTHLALKADAGPALPVPATQG